MNPRDLVGASRAELHRLLAGGAPFDARHLDETVYHGISLGLPRLIERLTWTKFAKVFARDDAGALRGWNVRIEQDGLDRPWRPMLRRGAPRTFGHFEVTDAAAYRIPTPCGGNVMLDYGRAVPRALSMAALRDPLVALDGGRGDLLLGWSYLDVAGRGLGTPSFFVLERGGPRRGSGEAYS